MDSYARRVVVQMSLLTLLIWLVVFVVVWNVMPAFWAREARIKTRVMLDEMDRGEERH